MDQKRCTYCEDKIPPNDIYQVEDCEVCEVCFDEYYACCSACEEPIHINDLRYCEQLEDNFCESCYERRRLECARCDWEYPRDTLTSCDDHGITDYDGFVCVDCFNHIGRGRRVIKDYSYKPTPIFFMGENEKPYEVENPKERRLVFGFELEVENIEREYENEEIIKGHLMEIFPKDFLYFKYDSSIDNGFEIVSHPMSKQFYKENKKKFELLLNVCKEFGLRSYESGRCGLHISVSRKSFTKLSFLKFVSFWNSNENKRMFKVLSQRQSRELSRWCRVNESYDKKTLIDLSKVKESNVNNLNHTIERYRALNLQNRNTLEIRLFRGTLHAPSFFKGFELVQSSYDWCNEGNLVAHKITKAEQNKTDAILTDKIKEMKGTEVAQITPTMVNRNWYQVFIHQNKSRFPNLFNSLDQRLPMFHLNGSKASLSQLNKQLRKGN